MKKVLISIILLFPFSPFTETLAATSVLLHGSGGWIENTTAGKAGLSVNRVEGRFGVQVRGDYVFPAFTNDKLFSLASANLDFSYALRRIRFYAGGQYLYEVNPSESYALQNVAYPRASIDFKLFKGVVILGRLGTRELSGELSVDTGRDYPMLVAAVGRYRMPMGGSEYYFRQMMLGLVIRLAPTMGPQKSAAEEYGSGYPTPGIDYLPAD
jgi:hypothetical protein